MGVNKTLDFKIFHVSSSSHVFYTIHHSYIHSCLSFEVDTKIDVQTSTILDEGIETNVL